MGAIHQALIGGSSSGLVADSLFSSVELLAHMEGTTPGIDSSSNARTLTAFGNAALTTTRSVFGAQAMETAIADSASSIRTAANLTLVNTDSLTIEARVYLTSSTGYRHIVQIGSATGSRLNLGVNAGKLKAYWNGTTGIHTASISLNTWYSVALVLANSSPGNWNCTFYQDGVVNSGPSGGGMMPLAAANSISIGTQQFSPAAGDEWLGSIDEVRVTRAIRHGGSYTPAASAFPDF